MFIFVCILCSNWLVIAHITTVTLKFAMILNDALVQMKNKEQFFSGFCIIENVFLQIELIENF